MQAVLPEFDTQEMRSRDQKWRDALAMERDSCRLSLSRGASRSHPRTSMPTVTFSPVFRMTVAVCPSSDT